MFDAGRLFSGARARLTGAVARLPPTALFVVSLLSVQSGSALATGLFSGLGPVGTVFSSTGFAALVLLLAAQPRFDSRAQAHIGLLSLYGLTLVCMELPFFLALQYLDLGLAATITFLGPLCLSALLSRRALHFLWIGVAGLGLALLAPDVGGALDPRGMGLAALSALSWAAFAPVSKAVGRATDGLDGLALAMTAATLMLLPPAFAEGSILTAGAWELSGAFLVALLSPALPTLIEFQVLQRMPTRTYGVLITLEPAMAVIVGFMVLGQPLGLRASLAVGCVTLAAIGMTLSGPEESSA